MEAVLTPNLITGCACPSFRNVTQRSMISVWLACLKVRLTQCHVNALIVRTLPHWEDNSQQWTGPRRSRAGHICWNSSHNVGERRDALWGTRYPPHLLAWAHRRPWLTFRLCDLIDVRAVMPSSPPSRGHSQPALRMSLLILKKKLIKPSPARERLFVIATTQNNRKCFVFVPKL